jgi:hypothetical protein
MRTEYYVKLKDGCIQNLFKIEYSDTKKIYRLTGSNSFALLISINNCLEGVVRIDVRVFEFFKTMFLKGDKKLWYSGLPVTEKHFEDNHFTDALQYVIQNNLFKPREPLHFKEGFLVNFASSTKPNSVFDLINEKPLLKQKPWVTPLPTKPKTKYTLYHGKKEVITGYSVRDSQEMAELLIDAITTGKSIKVKGETGEIIAFYNSAVVGEFSFSIYLID